MVGKWKSYPKSFSSPTSFFQENVCEHRKKLKTNIKKFRQFMSVWVSLRAKFTYSPPSPHIFLIQDIFKNETRKTRAENLGQLVESWPEPDHSCNPSTWELEAGDLEVQCYLQLHGEFKASLEYMRLLKNIHTYIHEWMNEAKVQEGWSNLKDTCVHSAFTQRGEGHRQEKGLGKKKKKQRVTLNRGTLEAG